jgi:hypothetical protein
LNIVEIIPSASMCANDVHTWKLGGHSRSGESGAIAIDDIASQSMSTQPWRATKIKQSHSIRCEGSSTIRSITLKNRQNNDAQQNEHKENHQ